jgi:hypothetical protein
MGADILTHARTSWYDGDMTKQLVARLGIWISLACVIFAAVALTINPHAFTPADMLRVDIPALASIIGFRHYLLHRAR